MHCTVNRWIGWVYLIITFQCQDPGVQRLNLLPSVMGPLASCFPTPNSVWGTQWKFNTCLSSEQQYHNNPTAEIPIPIWPRLPYLPKSERLLLAQLPLAEVCVTDGLRLSPAAASGLRARSHFSTRPRPPWLNQGCDAGELQAMVCRLGWARWVTATDEEELINPVYNYLWFSLFKIFCVESMFYYICYIRRVVWV